MKSKSISVLGSTGSIGTQTLDVIRESNGLFRAECICAGKDVFTLSAQANEFRPSLVGIYDESKVPELRELLSYTPEIVSGKDAASLCAEYPMSHTVVNGVCGISGFLPLMSAIMSGKTVAAANKESIVCAHSILEKNDSGNLTEPFSNGARIIPVDSEQSAIFQCLEEKCNVKSLILTASGGAFRDLSRRELENVTAADALSHPTWNMGRKITVDSASLFNKGLEVMEAAFLFGVDEIEVLIHRQSVVHSMVRFKDGSVKAQLSVPDMRGAIQYALTYPKRERSPLPHLNFTDCPLTLEQVDCEKYPAIPLAYEALREGRVLPVAYNAANEEAVEFFLQGRCKFTDIAKIVAYAMEKADTTVKYSDVHDIIETDTAARRHAAIALQNIN